MILFVDTSAFYALLDAADPNHERARECWTDVLAADQTILTSNYIAVETSALVQHRLGIEALRAFVTGLLPVATCEWIDERRHHAAVEMTLTAGKRGLSLVDCSSFVVMRELGVERAFCFDRDFRNQGFEVIPQ